MVRLPTLIATVAVIATAVCGLANGVAHAALQQRIVAVVNDEVVSDRDLNDRLALVLLTGGIDDSEQARDRLAPQVIRSLIEETLQLQEARRLELSVDAAEVEEALQNIAARNEMSVDQMRQFFVGNGVNLETLTRQIQAQIAWVKVVNRQIVPTVTVTVDQLDLAVQEARADEGQTEYLLSEIVLPVDDPAQADLVAQDADRLIQTLREGASFESLARQVSAAASGERGGDLGWVGASNVPPELRNELERLRQGEVSDPIPSAVGYHIFWLRERRIAARPTDGVMAELEVRLTQILFPASAGVSRDDLRVEAASLRSQLNDCQTMARIAAELDAPASGELGWVKIGDLPPEMAPAVASLPIGEVSQPLDGPAGIHLLIVCERKEPEQRTSPNRDQIGDRLQRERVERLARRYLRDLRKEAFVEVRF